MNLKWAASELNKFIALTTLKPSPTGYFKRLDASVEQIERQVFVVEQILDQITPKWRELPVGQADGWDTNEQWSLHRKAAIRAAEALRRDLELRENLGDGSPTIAASHLHAWVWTGAQSLWQSGHFRSAVEDALRKVNAETQNKVGRRDLSETRLFQESFSENGPQPGKPRLRRMNDDGSDTYKSLQRGAIALAAGIYAGIRNPLNHEAPTDLSEQIALEYLAALSVLARWVDEATVEEQ